MSTDHGSFDASGHSAFVESPHSARNGDEFLYMLGDFTTLLGVTTKFVGVFDGVTVTGLDTGVSESGVHLAAGGKTAVEYKGKIAIGGSFNEAGSGPIAVENLVAWDGTTFTDDFGDITDATSAIESVQASVVFEGDLIIGGIFDDAAGVSVSNVARWNGTVWAAMSTGLDGTVNELFVHEDTLYAVGAFTDHVAQWTGSTWAVLGTGLDHAGGGAQGRGLGTDDTDLIVSGVFDDFDSVAMENVGRWDGSNAFAMGSSLNTAGAAVVHAIEFFSDLTYATGIFTVSAIPNIASWDGAAWSGIGSGLNASGLDLEVYDGKLAIAGAFTSAGGVSASKVAFLVGTTFTNVTGGSTNGDIEWLETSTIG